MSKPLHLQRIVSVSQPATAMKLKSGLSVSCSQYIPQQGLYICKSQRGRQHREKTSRRLITMEQSDKRPETLFSVFGSPRPAERATDASSIAIAKGGGVCVWAVRNGRNSVFMRDDLWDVASLPETIVFSTDHDIGLALIAAWLITTFSRKPWDPRLWLTRTPRSTAKADATAACAPTNMA